jgi:hypothetical protein
MSAEQLLKAGILATSFGATDARSATHEELQKGCMAQNDSPLSGKCRGAGCGQKSVQAIAASHRRALESAKQRKQNWTAILEDDAAPVEPHMWKEGFMPAWKKIEQVAPDAKFVRLSWCTIVNEDRDPTDVFADAGIFTLTKSVFGLCTTAYMVHKDLVPEMLALFPSCSAVDGCYRDWLQTKEADGIHHGAKIGISMEIKGSREKIAPIDGTNGWLGAHGVLYQDRLNSQSTQEELPA